MKPETYLRRQRDGRAQFLRVLSVTPLLCVVAMCAVVDTPQGAMPGPWAEPTVPLTIALYSSWSTWNWLSVPNDADNMFAPGTGQVDPPAAPRPVGPPTVQPPGPGDMTDDEPLPFGTKHRGQPIGQVPASYLLFCLGCPWIGKFGRVADYINRNMERLNWEVKRKL